jgi:hypothetical protein
MLVKWKVLPTRNNYTSPSAISVGCPTKGNESIREP